jgi:hypothetical protein
LRDKWSAEYTRRAKACNYYFEILEQFTFLRPASGGMSIPFTMAKEMGYIPPDARVEDFP